jgi:hypothetical protein
MDRIQELVASTGCDERLAVVIDRFTDGDLEKARKIIFSIPKDLVLLAVRFTSEQERRYGLVVCIRNLPGNRDEFFDVLISQDKDLLSVNPDAPLEALRRAFENWRASGKVDEVETREVREYLGREAIRKELADLIGTEAVGPEPDRIKPFFSEVFFRSLAETGGTIHSECRRTDAFRLYSGERALNELSEQAAPAADQAQEAETDKGAGSGPSASAIFLTAYPVIAPIDGRPIPKCKPGDVIFTDISDSREFAVYLKKLLLEEMKNNGYTEGGIPAVIEEMEYAVNTDNVSIIVRYGPGIYGRILVSRDLKIGAPRKPNPDEEAEAKRPSYNWIVWVFVISFVVVVLLTLFLKK